MAESALLEQESTPSNVVNHDEVPIGGGNKFTLS